MSIKEEILKKLDEEKGNPVSGEELAKQLGVSRNAVWKAVKVLREEGYGIQATTNKGYVLSSASDVLTAEKIRSRLSFNCNVIVKKCVDSTNDEVKALAAQGATEWTVVIAEEQTKGRGRNQRSFFFTARNGVVYERIVPSYFFLFRISVCHDERRRCRMRGDRKSQRKNSTDQMGERRLSRRKKSVRDFDGSFFQRRK